jgi:tryptophan-rich sensory protein
MSQGAERLTDGGGQRWLALAGWLAVVAIVALIGSWATLTKIPTWYASLAKPSFTPPNAVFGPVWTVLYVMMAVAVWRVSRADGPMQSRAVVLFVAQLGLNAVWSPVFFGLEAPRLGLAVILALCVSLAATLAVFWRVDRLAGLLLVPYLAWVCYASALNAAIVALN